MQFTAPNYDYDAQAQDLARRQKIAEAMQAQSLSPMELPQQAGVRASPLAAVAKIVQAYVANKQMGDLKGERQSMADRYKTEGQEGLQRFFDTITPKSVPLDNFAGEEGPLQTPDPATAGTFTQPGNQRKAVLEAMASNHPMLQQIGAAQLPGLLKGSPSKDHVINNKLVRVPEGGGPTVLGDFNDPKVKELWGPVEEVGKGPDGKPITGQKNLETGQIRFTPAGTNVKVETNVGDKSGVKFGEELGKARAKQISDSYDKVKDVPQTLTTLNDAATNLAAGIKSGALGEVQLTIAKLGKSLGIGNGDPQMANTETFRASMAQSVLAILKTLRPASDKDVEYAEKAAGGKITLDDKTMLRLINSARAAGYNTFLDHDRLLERSMALPGGKEAGVEQFRIPMTINADAETFDYSDGRFSVKGPDPATGPSAPSGTAAKPMSWDDYRKSKGLK